jgi:HPt (histidine-containing phosphotransfer) domain-containing protein
MMNYFFCIVLCIATVSAEAIPQPLTLDPVQESLYQMAFETSKALNIHQITTPPAEKPKPSVVSVSTPEIEAAKAMAIALYGNEPGFLGVTDRVMTTEDGQRFLYINIRADGNCGFYALGITRAAFVQVITDLINENHDVYQTFVAEREALIQQISHTTLAEDKTAIAARVQRLARGADNGDVVTSALKLLTDFATEKTAYHQELFNDARTELVKNLQKLEKLPTVQSNSKLREQITTLIAELTAATVGSVDVVKLTDQRDALIDSLTHVGVNVTKIQTAFNELITVCGYKDVPLFELGKRRLINKILNLRMLGTYESFLEALRKELIASGVNEANLTTKDIVLAAVTRVFSVNRGADTWIPGGLFASIKDKLGVKYNIWARDAGNAIKMYFGGDISGAQEKGPKIRNAFFTGVHYDMLIPILRK